MDSFVEVDQISAWWQCNGVTCVLKRQDRGSGCLALRIIEVNSRCGGPFGDLTKGEINAAGLLLGGTAEILHQLAGDDFKSAEYHDAVSVVRWWW